MRYTEPSRIYQYRNALPMARIPPIERNPGLSRVPGSSTEPMVLALTSLFNLRESDARRFSEKLSFGLMGKLERLASEVREMPLDLKFGHFAVLGKIEGAFLYDLQAPGLAENYLLLSKLGLLKRIGRILGVEALVGLTDESLASQNKEFQNLERPEIQKAIRERLGIIKNCGLSLMDYRMPENLDGIMERIKEDPSLSNLIDGEAAQVFGWKDFKTSEEKKNLARKYFISQIAEMLKYIAENPGKICIHFGPESEKAWDKVIAVILREKKCGLFGLEIENAGFFAIHYQRPFVGGLKILPYTPKNPELIPLLNDDREKLIEKIAGLPVFEREQLRLGLGFLCGKEISEDIRPDSLADGMLKFSWRGAEDGS